MVKDLSKAVVPQIEDTDEEISELDLAVMFLQVKIMEMTIGLILKNNPRLVVQ